MRYVKGLSCYLDKRGTSDKRGSVVTFGKFDGLHRGHQKLVEKVLELGKENDIASVVCAFDMRPLWKERNLSMERLMTGGERVRHLEGKVDYLVGCPFTEDFRNMTAEEFVREVIGGIFHAKYVVVGTDFHFGKNQGGDVGTLRRYAKECGYCLIVVEKERYKDHVISSTYIRDALREGNVCLANYLLGYPFEVCGKVEHGRRLGRTLGFPTINVAWPKQKLVPPKGVYVSRIAVGDATYPAISNVGVKPTVSKDNKVVLESFLFGYDGDAYGENVRAELLEFCRPEEKFASVEEMKARVDRDIAYGKKYFGIE